MTRHPMSFFEPTQEFVVWVKEAFEGRPVLDAGCGFGNLTDALLRAGVAAVGIDLQHSKIESGQSRYPAAAGKLLVGDTTEHPLVRLSAAVVIFGRPCHDPSWIARTVEASASTASAWVYISKPGNAENDIASFERRRVLVAATVGDEGEEAWEFRPVPDDFDDEPVRWCLVEFPGRGPTWVRDGEGVWYWNWSPSYCSKHDETVLEDAWVQDDDWLDHSKTAIWQQWEQRVRDTSLDNAWVSPDGEVYRCAYWEHNSLANDYLRRRVRDLESGCWCKVQRAPGESQVFSMGYDDRGRDHRLRKEQVSAMLEAGFDVPVWKLEEAEGDWSEAIEQRRQQQ